MSSAKMSHLEESSSTFETIDSRLEDTGPSIFEKSVDIFTLMDHNASALAFDPEDDSSMVSSFVLDEVEDFTEAFPRSSTPFPDENQELALEEITETQDFVEISTKPRKCTVTGRLRRNWVIVARLIVTNKVFKRAIAKLSRNRAPPKYTPEMPDTMPFDSDVSLDAQECQMGYGNYPQQQ